MIDQSKHRETFKEALEIAGEFAPELEARLRLTDAILVMYRRGWADGADHVLDELGRLANAARETRAEPKRAEEFK